MKQFTLHKAERLYLRESISDLFANGHSFVAFPYRVTYQVLDEMPNPRQDRCAMMAVAPKKRFKHAVDRNHVKRLTREAYRLQKLPLKAALEENGKALEVAFIYVDNKFIDFDLTCKVIGRVLARLEKEITRSRANTT